MKSQQKAYQDNPEVCVYDLNQEAEKGEHMDPNIYI